MNSKTNWYKRAKKKTLKELFAEHSHYKITCTGCGDVHQCRCSTIIHDVYPPYVGTVDSCYTCEEELDKEASVSPSASPSPSQPMSVSIPTSEEVSMSPPPYSDNAAVQKVMLRRKKKKRRKRI